MANYTYNPVPLSEGGEKIVHRGECQETGLPVVVKFLRQPYTQLDIDRLAHEVQRLQAAQGAGVASLIDWNLEWHPPFFVEEYFPDGTLAEHMATRFRQGYRFSESEALDYAEQILRSLADLHARNLIHRDIKPHNIMMSGGALVLTDMGLGRTRDRSTSLQTRAFLGTKYYASPEQELGSGGVDHRSDLYSAGVVLHELLTGERGAWNRQTYGQHAGVRTVIARLLMFARDQRYTSALQVLRLVQGLRHSL